jgi:hypothetical protein
MLQMRWTPGPSRGGLQGPEQVTPILCQDSLCQEGSMVEPECPPPICREPWHSWLIPHLLFKGRRWHLVLDFMDLFLSLAMLCPG